jgi:hypothetical protein
MTSELTTHTVGTTQTHTHTHTQLREGELAMISMYIMCSDLPP